MDKLHAPWRFGFVTGQEGPPPQAPSGCIFCDYPQAHPVGVDAASAEHDRVRLVVHTRPHAFVIMNKYPYAGGHVMVVPRQHTDQLEQIPAAAFAGLQELLRDTVAAVRACYRPEGVNVGMNMGRAAGAGIADHVHWHIVPRWVGDTNFMPVLADTKVISEGMAAAYQRLREHMGPGRD